MDFNESQISGAIVDAYYNKFRFALQSDVVIVGAGPSGLVAAWKLASAGRRVVILEKRLSPGGGIWGGSCGMNEAAVQPAALPLLEEAEVNCRARDNLNTVYTAELACALCLKAFQAGAKLLNLMAAEDLCVHDNKVDGVVANRTLIGETLPVDPIVFTTKAVIDATGHEASVINCLTRRSKLENVPDTPPGEGIMNATEGERFVVKHVREVFPGLWVTGMSVCATAGGPRMGPIFGGMLLSGARVAEMINAKIAPGQKQ